MQDLRIEKIRDILDELKLDAFYVTHIPNIRYLTGFSGSSATVLISRKKNYFLTDFRYKEQSARQVKGFEIIINYLADEELKKIIAKDGFKSFAFESTHLTVHQLDTLKKKFADINFSAVPEGIEKLTMIKTPEELVKMQKAIDITDDVFSKLLDIIKPGMKENDVAAQITYWHKMLGADKDSFDPIVASGWRGALPHGMASDKIIEKGEMVTLDFGCVYNGFCSDMTRTISVGEPSAEMKKIYDIVKHSQQLALDAAKQGITTKQLDSVARDYIYAEGFEGKFGHGLGHGLGIEVHEMPSVSQRMDIVLPENAVVTIEPGIYVEGLGGVRIEDDILILTNGCEVLNRSPKGLIVI
jgi:Xaa-Pro aminopeptidase